MTRILFRSFPRRALLFAPLMAMAVSACGPIVELPGNDEAPSLYALTPVRDIASSQRFPERTLMIEEPAAPAALSSKRIALMPGARELSFYAGAEWIDRAPRMLQSLLLTSFEETGAFEDVGPENMTLAANSRLALRLRAFNSDYTAGGDPVVRIEITARLYNTRPLALAGTRLIEIEEPVGSDRMTDIIGAFDRANRQAMEAIVRWTLEKVAPSGDAQTTGP